MTSKSLRLITKLYTYTFTCIYNILLKYSWSTMLISAVQQSIQLYTHTHTHPLLCHYDLLWKWMCSYSALSDSLQPHGLQPARLLCPWNSPGKNTGVDCHFLLQGSSQPRDWIWVSHIAGRFFSILATSEALMYHRIPNIVPCAIQ